MLLTRLGEMACAFPIAQVIETMRPLPVEPLGTLADGALAAITGMAMIRGEPVPVVDARRLLGIAAGRDARFVIVRVADRRFAVVVDDVLDVRDIANDVLVGLPPLLRDASRDSVSAIGARDAGLLIVLDAARLLPEASWQALAQPGAPRGHAPPSDPASDSPSDPSSIPRSDR